jgi:hypothetical protein
MTDTNHERAIAVLLQVAQNADLDAAARVRACELLLSRPPILPDSTAQQPPPNATQVERAERAERARVALSASGGLVKRLPVE